ncbi:hypothetical protein P8452_66691 [Trifolium repens]|nr:hypothetical protein P8452_66691 [Trifolium repens]
MDRVLLQERTVEGDDLVDMKSERKHVESVKRLRSEFKRLKSEVKRLKLERKQLKSEVGTSEITFYRVPDRKESNVEGGKGLKSEVKRLKSEVKRLKSEFKGLKSEVKRLKSERKQLESDFGISEITFYRVPDRKESNVEGGKGLKSEVKRLKSEVKQLKSKLKRVKSEWKHVKRGTQMKSEPEQKQTGNRLRSPFDAIDPPPNSLKHDRARVVLPVSITDKNRPFLIELSKLALKKYNDGNNQDPQFEPFEFDELLKSTFGIGNGRKYYITFKAKQSSDDASSKIFQGLVWRKLDGSSEARTCDIKI